MKTITLVDNNSLDRYQVNIVYTIFDSTNTRLTNNYEVCSAENSQGALGQYNKHYGLNRKYKRVDAYKASAVVCVSSVFYDKAGNRYRHGKKTWFEVVEK